MSFHSTGEANASNNIYAADDPVTRRSPIFHYLRLIIKLISVTVLGIVTAALWPLYWLGTAVWYRPPNVPRAAQVRRYLRLAWTVQPPAPGLSFIIRFWITLSIMQKVVLIPVFGIAWLLDELFYGRSLKNVSVSAPLLVISAGRSGSTQIARYLEEDPQLAAPSLLQFMFPYLWLWHLAGHTIGRLFSPDQIRQKVFALTPPELLERHEADPFRTDTFDGAFYSIHMNHLAFALGPEVAAAEFGFAEIGPHSHESWEADFVQLVEGIGRKTLLFAGGLPDGSARRLFIKGHFLWAAEALKTHYPEAIFLTVIREPAARLRSAINYLRVNPSHPVLGPVPWAWLAAALEQTERRYCEVEQAWFTQPGDARRCVIRFSNFIQNLEAAMLKVYQECLDVNELPPHIPRNHPPRERKKYSVNRSLADLGIDEVAYRAELKSFITWCCETDPS